MKTSSCLLAGGLALSVLALSVAGVYAGLNAQATGAETVSSGTLNLTLSADVGAAFPSTFSAKMAPGDADNVFVDLTNTGTLASAAGMTLWVAGSPLNALTDGSVSGEGISVTMTQCSVAWILATASCSGTTTNILSSTQVSTMNTLGTAVSLSNIPSLAATSGSAAHIEASLTLVATETSTNGAPPASTVQGLPSTTLTYTFTEIQRTAATTNQ